MLSYKDYGLWKMENNLNKSYLIITMSIFEKMVEKVSEYYNKYVKETPKLILPTLPKLTKIN